MENVYMRVLRISPIFDAAENIGGYKLRFLDEEYISALILTRKEGNDFVLSRNYSPKTSFGRDMFRIPVKLVRTQPDLVSDSLYNLTLIVAKEIRDSVERNNPGCLVVIE